MIEINLKNIKEIRGYRVKKFKQTQSFYLLGMIPNLSSL